MGKDLMVLLFAIAAGLTLSGIVANLYRMLAHKPQTTPARIAYFAVMAVAGPSVLFENATKSFRSKNCSRVAYAFALALALYWASMLGLFVLDMSIVL